jgi:DNA-binding transcriptional regulator YdaS (Cro superfamily)
MKLSDYLSSRSLTDQAFADVVGVNRTTVTRWRNGRMPDPHQMALIADKTEGDVTPNDFVLPQSSPAPEKASAQG